MPSRLCISLSDMYAAAGAGGNFSFFLILV